MATIVTEIKDALGAGSSIESPSEYKSTVYGTFDTFTQGKGQPVLTGKGQVNGLPVLDLIPDYDEGPQFGAMQLVQALETQNKTELMYGPQPRRKIKAKWVFNTPTEMHKFVRFWSQRQGLKEEFYVPSYFAELPDEAVATQQNTVVVDVSTMGFLEKAIPDALFIFDYNTGRLHYSGTTYAIDEEAETITFTLARSIPWTSDRVMMGFMYRVRWDSGSVALRIEQAGAGYCTMDLIEVLPGMYTNTPPSWGDETGAENTLFGEYRPTVIYVEVADALEAQHTAPGRYSDGIERPEVQDSMNARHTLAGVRTEPIKPEFPTDAGNANMSLQGTYTEVVIVRTINEGVAMEATLGGTYADVIEPAEATESGAANHTLSGSYAIP